MHTEADKDLVRLLKNGNIDAFDELFSKYSRRIYFFAISFLKNKEDSEGIVQETFFRIWKNRKKIDEYCSFRSFLFSISYNLIMDHFRKKLKEKEYCDFLKSRIQIKDFSTDKEIDFHNLNEHYQELIQQLPERRRQIYMMARFEGCSSKEIARRLKISVNTVENQMTAALKFLRKKLGQESIIALIFYNLFW